eukprot:154874_1
MLQTNNTIISTSKANINGFVFANISQAFIGVLAILHRIQFNKDAVTGNEMVTTDACIRKMFLAVLMVAIASTASVFWGLLSLCIKRDTQDARVRKRFVFDGCALLYNMTTTHQMAFMYYWFYNIIGNGVIQGCEIWLCVCVVLMYRFKTYSDIKRFANDCNPNTGNDSKSYIAEMILNIFLIYMIYIH